MKNILFLFSLISSCVAAQVKQGISGKVYLQQGNNMPSPGRPASDGKPVSKQIFIYELTRREQVTMNGSFFSDIKTKLVAKATSNSQGYYEAALPAGVYSVFVEDDDHLYANSFDNNGNICPVEVKKDSVTNKDLIISTKAVY